MYITIKTSTEFLIADRGMACDGDDKESYEVAIIDDGEVDIRL